MPYSTSNNQGMSQAANAIAKIFIGDPEADAKFRDQQIKNETEFARQKMIAEQTLSESVRREQMKAAAAASMAAASANQGLANERGRKNKAAEDLGSIFTEDHRNFGQTGGMSMPGDAPAGTPGAGFDLNNPAIASRIVGNVMQGEIDPKVLSAAALMPGQDDATLGRIMTGSGDAIGKDDYVSVGDRNANRNYELGATERLVGGDGQVRTGVDPSYSSSQNALSNQRNATAGRQNALAAAGGGGKIPKLDAKEMNRFLRDAIMSRGGTYDQNTMMPAQYLSGQPELYADMSQIIDEAYRASGGRASAVQDALARYLSETDFTNFYEPGGWGGPKYNPVTRPDMQAVLQMIQGQQGIAPEIFTEGGDADLPNLQNVGNGGAWKIIGVE